MADEKQQLQEARFANVPFWVEPQSFSANFSRRPTTPETPYNNKPGASDDTGRRAVQYSMQAFLLGPNVREHREKLLAAFRKEGVSELMHPLLGSLQVRVESVDWSLPQSNMDRFKITFVEASEPEKKQLAGEVSTGEGVNDAVNKVKEAQTNAVAKVLENITKGPNKLLDTATGFLKEQLGQLQQITGVIKDTSGKVTALTNAFDETVAGIDALILAPRDLAVQVIGLVGKVLGLDDHLRGVMSGYRAIGKALDELDHPAPLTPTRVAEAAMRSAVTQLILTGATIETASLVATKAAAIGVTSNSDSPFDSADEATAIRDELVQALDKIALTADDTLFGALQDLQAALVAHIDAHGNSLPRVVHVSFNNMLPMLAIAHQIDGDVTRESDFITRNKIRHPLFVSAGRTLEVLSA